jgi:hypothetical protein
MDRSCADAAAAIFGRTPHSPNARQRGAWGEHPIDGGTSDRALVHPADARQR